MRRPVEGELVGGRRLSGPIGLGILMTQGGHCSDAMQGHVVARPVTIGLHGHQLLDTRLGNQQAIKGLVMQHRQERSTCGKALIAEGGRFHSQLAKAVLDGHLPDAGDLHQAWSCGQHLSCVDAQPWIVKEPPEHHLGVGQQAHQLLNSSATC